MIYLINATIALVALLVITNGFLRGAWRTQIDVSLGVALLALLGAVFYQYGWMLGCASVLWVFLVCVIGRPVAARLAVTLLSIGEHSPRSYIGLPDSRLLRISCELAKAIESRPIVHDLVNGPERGILAKERLFEYCLSQPATRAVLSDFSVDESTLRDLYRLLLIAGAAQWAGGHWVVASALAHPHTLRFILTSNRNGTDLAEIAYALIMHFERGAALASSPRLGR